MFNLNHTTVFIFRMDANKQQLHACCIHRIASYMKCVYITMYMKCTIKSDLP